MERPARYGQAGVTSTGDRCMTYWPPVIVPAAMPLPQHRSRPPATIAQLSEPPAAMATAPVTTSVAGGVRREVVVPSPSWPASFAPQQRTPPDSSSAQVWPKPAATAFTPPSALAAGGLAR